MKTCKPRPPWAPAGLKSKFKGKLQYLQLLPHDGNSTKFHRIWKQSKKTFRSEKNCLFINLINVLYQFRFSNVLAQAAALVGSPLADEGFLYHSETAKDENGNRTYGELNTGQWWERTEKDNQFPKVDR